MQGLIISHLQIRLKEYGSELIEVADNGCGIKPEDYEAFALKYHTSKISSFDEVSVVKTFGFRGEAISSLCAVSSLTVTTRTRTQDVATKLDFDRGGALTGVRWSLGLRRDMGSFQKKDKSGMMGGVVMGPCCVRSKDRFVESQPGWTAARV